MEHSDMVNVSKTNLFPTSIYEFESEVTDQQHKDMIDYIADKFENKYKNVQTGEDAPFGLYQGDDNLHLKPEFKYLTDFVHAISSNIFVQEGYEYQKVEVTQMWANLQNDGSIHPPHTHANSIHSGIYYLKASEKTSGTQFFDPRGQCKVLVPRKDKYLIQNSNMFQVHSKTGHGVVFPSWLQHWVPSNKGERITISWNVIMRGEYGEAHTLQNANI